MCAPDRPIYSQGEDLMIRSVLVVLGVIFLVIACVYWLVPAGSLPSYVPGYEAGVPRVHVKHGVAALVVAAVCFLVAWFVGRSQLGRL
jgi:branched-subunit amino acid ABC-type transport system permease component